MKINKIKKIKSSAMSYIKSNPALSRSAPLFYQQFFLCLQSHKYCPSNLVCLSSSSVPYTEDFWPFFKGNTVEP